MSIASIASKKACSGATGGANTGKLGCLSLFGTPTHLVALRKGTVIPATEDFDSDFATSLVAQGIAIPLIDASAFEDVSSEDSYSTNAKGIKRLNVKGLPEYKLMFEEGHEFYKQLARLEGYKNYDYLIGDAEGNWMMAEKSNGDFQGFTGGHTTPELTKRKVEGGDPESKSILVQFLDRLQWDKNYTILHAEDLDMTPQEFPVINGTEIVYTTNPADTDTVLEIKVVLASDRDTVVEGLEATDFVVTNDGVTPAISALAEPTPGNYQLTIDTAVETGDKVKVDHFNGTHNTTVAISNDVLYRNTVVNEAVVA